MKGIASVKEGEKYWGGAGDGQGAQRSDRQDRTGALVDWLLEINQSEWSDRG